MKKHGLICTFVTLALLVTVLPAGAQTFGRALEEVTPTSAIAVTPISPARPPSAAIDNQPATAWGAPAGSTQAGLVLGFTGPRVVGGLKIQGHVEADTTVTVTWFDGISYQPFLGGTLRGGFDGEITLDLSLERASTTKIMLTLTGPSAPSSYVSQVDAILFTSMPAMRYLPPTQIVPSSNTSWLFGAEWLADGDVSPAWRAGSWGDYSAAGVFWGITAGDRDSIRRSAGRAARTLKKGDLDAPPLPFAVGPFEGGAIFQYDQAITVQRVKLWFAETALGSVRLQVETASGWQTFATVASPQVRNAWTQVDLQAPVSGTRFKLLMTEPHGNVGDIGELELWGTVADTAPVVVAGESLSSSAPGTALLRFIPPEKGLYALEILTDGTAPASLTADINGRSVGVTPAGAIAGGSLFRATIDTGDWEENELWVSFPLGATMTVRSARLRPVVRNGEWPLTGTSALSDGSLISDGGGVGTTQWILDRKLAVDSVEVRGTGAAQALVRVRSGGAWLSLTSQAQQGLSIFPCGMTVDGIEVTAFDPLSEVTLLGSPTDDLPPSIRVLLPDGEMARDSGVLVGTVTGKVSSLTVNGMSVQRFGPYFAIRLSDANPGSDTEFSVTIRATDTSGRVATLSDRWYRTGIGPLQVDQAATLQSTTAASVQISGRTAGQVWSIEVNGTPVTVTQNTFSVTVPVSRGFNSVVVAARRKSTGAIDAVRVVHVVRYDTSFSVDMTTPVTGSFIATGRPVVGGTLSGAVSPVTVTVNGLPATVQGNQFSTPAGIPIAEGDNAILITAKDGLNRVVSRTFHVTVDTVKPAVSFTSPEAGAYVGFSLVTLRVNANDANAINVTIDGAVAALSDGLYQVTKTYGDGGRTIVATATDAAGNSATAGVSFTVDTTPPEPFSVTLTPDGWTNVTTATVSFQATDVITGIAGYTIKVDAGDVFAAVSPAVVGPLADGEHLFTVTAIDLAGNSRSSTATARIDTTPPPAPVSFRGIEGPGQVQLAWVSPADDVVSYTVTRNPAWSSGSISVTAETYVDSGLADGSRYEYSMVAVDHAGNVGLASTDSSMVGIAVAPVDTAQPATVVEFQNVDLFFANDGLPPGTTSLEVTTAQSPDLEAKATFGMASPIYDFSATVTDTSGGHQEEGVEFSKEYIGTISYDPSTLPEGYPEENLGLYYWDTTWSQWLLVDKFAVDTQEKKVVFATSHFTMFSIQPTMIQDLSPQMLKDVGFSPFKAQVTQGGITVSTQGGSAMTEATEFSLPGKAGFDFVLKRTYDAVTARGDSPGLSLNAALSFSLKSIVDNAADLTKLLNADSLQTILGAVGSSVLAQVKAKIDGIFRNSGDYAYSTGVGWRLNLPYIRSAGGRVLVRTPSGGFYSVNNMTLKVDNLSGISRRLILENHEGEDFTVVVRQVLAITDITTISPKDGQSIPLPVLSWILTSATMVLKDGTQYSFDALGRVTSIVDGTGTNTITFAYGGTLGYFLDTITDSMGRVLKFQYDNGGSNSIIPRIQSITLLDDPQNRRVTYTYTDRTLDGGGNPGVPLLAAATDAIGRTWTYGYDRTAMLEGGVSIKVNFLALLLETVPGLSTLAEWAGIVHFPSALTLSGHLSTEIAYTLGSTEGPGIGYNRVNTSLRTFIGADLELTDYLFGFIPTGLQGSLEFPAQLSTSSVSEYVSSTGPLIKRTTYAYSFYYAGHQQILNSRTVVDDGRTITTHSYTVKDALRWTYLTAEDYLTSVSIIMAPLTYTEKVPYETSYTTATEPTPTTHSTVLETTMLTYDVGTPLNPGTMRPLSRTVSRTNDHKSAVTYQYDDWGNVTSTTESTTDSGTTVSKTTTASYYIKPYSGSQPNSVPAGSPYRLPTLTVPRMDLPLTQLITYSVPGAEPASQVVYYTYDSLGRKSAEKAVIGGKALETTYAYEVDEHHELTTVASPAGTGGRLLTTINHDYTPSSFYIVTTTKHNVDLGTGSPVDLQTVAWYGRYSGLKMFERDARGNITSYTYDAVGRPRSVIKPGDDDVPFSDPLGGIGYQSGNPRSTMEYDDDDFAVAVKGNRGQDAVYDFDQAGRLNSITKTVRTLDSSGQPTTVGQTQITGVGYDKWGDITSIRDPNGKLTTYSYDAMGRLSGITYPLEPDGQPHKTIFFNYATNTQTSTDERGFVSIEYYDMAGRKTGTEVYPDGPGKTGRIVTTAIAYDGLGREAKLTDEKGGITTKSYDERGNIVQIKTPVATFYEGGQKQTPYAPETDLTYDDLGAKLTETLVTQAGTFQTRYENNELGLPLAMERSYTDHTGGSASAAVARETYGYDANGNRTRVVDANGGAPKTTEYSARGKVLSETDTAGNKTTYLYDLDDNQIQMTDPRGNDSNYTGNYSAQFIYDDVNRLVKGIIPSASGGDATATVSFQYDPRGNLLQRTDADGTVTTYTYSARNKPLTELKGEGAGSILTTRAYNESALEKETVVGGIYTTAMEYDGLGRLKRTTLPSSSYQALEYDDAGNVSRRENGLQHATTSVYDAYKRLVSETDAAGHTRHLSYDARGNLTREIDAKGNERLLSYDELGRLIEERRADGEDYLYGYDAVGNMSWSRDASGITTTYTYTPDYHLKRVEKTLGTRTESQSFTWDKAGNRESATSAGATLQFNAASGSYVSDPYGRVRSVLATVGTVDLSATWSYDEGGRVTKVTLPSGETPSYRYDAIGQLSEVTDWASGFQYDAGGRLKGYRLTNDVGATQGWDTDGRVTALGYAKLDQAGLPSYTFGYDNAANMTNKLDTVSGFNNAYTYDNMEWLLTSAEKDWSEHVQAPLAGSVAEDYTAQGVLSFGADQAEIKVDKASTSIGADLKVEREIFGLTLYPDSPTDRVRAGTFEVWAQTGTKYEKITGMSVKLNGQSGAVEIRFTEPVITQFIKIHCLYDERDTLDQAVDAAQFHNQAARLLEVSYRLRQTVQSYSYDEKGNRLSVGTTVMEAANTTTSNITATYWPLSDRVKTYGDWTYVYDANGNLVEKGTRYSDGVGFSADTGSYVRYDWDLFGRLVGVSKGEGGTGSAVAVATYAYDADGLRVEKTAGGVVTRWLYGPDGNPVLEQSTDYAREYVYAEGKLLGYWETRGTTTSKYFTLTDQVGSVVSTTDALGAEVSKRDYLAFGAEAGTESTTETVALYTGKEFDTEVGLYYYNARWYDPELGRFISEDPIKDLENWYIYVSDNPLTRVDPTGRDIISTFALDLMTNYSKEVKLGNSLVEQLRKVGCYPTALGNALGTLQYLTSGKFFDKPSDYKSTLALNNRPELFLPESGLMPRSSMDKVFGAGKWDYWTKAKQGTEGLQEKLKEYAESGKQYMVIGIFDLSSANPDAPNHMVGLNALPDENGVFSPGSILPSAQGDITMLSDPEQRKAYSLANLKEIRVIEVKPTPWQKFSGFLRSLFK